jgi:hypothetical protein
MMDKGALLEKIKSPYTKEQLVAWITSMPGVVKTKPDTFKVGDVFMSRIFHHPIVLLRKRKSDWICTVLTSEESCKEILEPCESRFYKNSFFTKALFTTQDLENCSFMGVYENNKHLTEVYKKLKQSLL